MGVLLVVAGGLAIAAGIFGKNVYVADILSPLEGVIPKGRAFTSGLRDLASTANALRETPRFAWRKRLRSG